MNKRYHGIYEQYLYNSMYATLIPEKYVHV
jgi:hypothetical protein